MSHNEFFGMLTFLSFLIIIGGGAWWVISHVDFAYFFQNFRDIPGSLQIMFGGVVLFFTALIIGMVTDPNA